MRIMLAALLYSASSLAAGPAWQYGIKDRVKPGQPAVLTLGAHNTVHDVKLVVRGPGKTRTFAFKTLVPGKKKTVRWAVPAGVSEWTGELTGSADGATTTATLNLKIAAIAPLDVQLSKKDVDLGAGRIVVIPSHAVDHAEVKAFGEGGAVVVDETVQLGGATGRVPIEFGVSDGDTIKRLEVKVHDAHGFWAGVRVVSWYAEIPHEDVEFESGKWEIRPGEAPKIDEVFERLEAELARFKKELGRESVQVSLKIYVAGHTDTVGAPGDNRVLSRKRAKAIAEYFKAHKAKLPIYYQGFGEAALAVKTPDNTPEARNRRATYILSNVPPRGGQFPGARWIPLD